MQPMGSTNSAFWLLELVRLVRLPFVLWLMLMNLLAGILLLNQ